MIPRIDVTIEPKEVAECVSALGWTFRGLADTLGVPEKRVRTGKLDPAAVEVLRARAKAAKAHPFPAPEDRPSRTAKIEATIAPGEVADCLSTLGWTTGGFATLLGVPQQRVRAGKLDADAAAVLRLRAEQARATPFPVAEQDRAISARQRRAADRRLRENREAAHQSVA